MMSKIKKILRGVFVALFWLGVWAACAAAIGKSVILPSPAAVLRTLISLLGTKSFYVSCGYSLLRIFTGLLAGVVVGTALAVLTEISGLARALLSPVAEVIKATPVASVIIVLLFILSKQIVPTLAAALMVFPILFMNVRKGMTSVSQSAKEVALVYDFSAKKKLRMLYMPSVMPYFSAGCKSALGLAWKAGIAAEVLCTPKNSIGTMIYDSKIYLESETLFAWTAVVVLLSFLIEKLLVGLLDKLFKGAAENA